MTKLSVAILLLSLYVAFVVSAEECLPCTDQSKDVEAGKKLCGKVPPAFYCKLKKVCANIEGFVTCLIGDGALSKAEAAELKDCFLSNGACEKMPDIDCTKSLSKPDKEKFKAFVEELASVKAIACRLLKLTSKIKSLMKCTK